MLYLDEYGLVQSIFNDQNTETTKTHSHILYKDNYWETLIFFCCYPERSVENQSRFRQFETPWRAFDVTVMTFA